MDFRIMIDNKSNNVDVNFSDIIKKLSDEKDFDFFDYSRMVELANNKRTNLSAYYTDEIILQSVSEKLPCFKKKNIRILEPSVGAGNFLPYLANKYRNHNVILDLIDIDSSIINILKKMVKLLELPDNFQVHYINSDFFEHNFDIKYDLVVGNPPFTKINKKSNLVKDNKSSRNMSSYFLEKVLKLSKNVLFIMPKNFLNTPEFSKSRESVPLKNLSAIIDFGENGFKGVLIETICLVFTEKESNFIEISSISKNLKIIQDKNYITDKKLPYWIIYRDKKFDELYIELELGLFKVFRDRQITNKILMDSGEIPVIRSRNINDDGTEILSLKNYDKYVSKKDVENLKVFDYYNKEVLITPNMTYNSRISVKPKGHLVNGSLAILIPKFDFVFNEVDAKFISTIQYRDFLRVARNYQTRSLNIDNNSVYFYGRRKRN